MELLKWAIKIQESQGNKFEILKMRYVPRFTFNLKIFGSLDRLILA